MKKVEGVFAPIATPFKADGNIDFVKYAENLAKFDKTGLAGIVALGSNGEFTMLSPERAASPERGVMRPTWPAGIATLTPVPTRRRSPGASTQASVMVRSAPASPGRA